MHRRSCWQPQHQTGWDNRWHLRGRFAFIWIPFSQGRAQKLLERSIDLLESSVHPEDIHRVRLYGLMAENLVNSGRAAEAEDWFNKCRLFLTDFHEDWLEARLHLMYGPLEASQAACRANRAAAKQHIRFAASPFASRD